MSDLGSGPVVYGPQEEEKKTKRTLNRLYWIFMVTGLIVVAYGLGWIMAYTGSCVCSTN